jgi:hypothetical protein
MVFIPDVKLNFINGKNVPALEHFLRLSFFFTLKNLVDIWKFDLPFPFAEAVTEWIILIGFDSQTWVFVQLHFSFGIHK